MFRDTVTVTASLVVDMGAYQYKREPLTGDEANRLANTCTTHLEQLII